jgi:bifunctional DNase/RNase
VSRAEPVCSTAFHNKDNGTANMTTVTLRDVFHNSERGESWIVLADETGQKGLPIFVGSWDAKFIITGLNKKTSRPMTFHFFANVLEAIEADLVEVQVVAIVERTFRAVTRIRIGGVEKQIDARPSDAVALAAVMNRPIRVNEELMTTFGTRLDPEGRPPDAGEGFVSMRWCWENSPRENA